MPDTNSRRTGGNPTCNCTHAASIDGYVPDRAKSGESHNTEGLSVGGNLQALPNHIGCRGDVSEKPAQEPKATICLLAGFGRSARNFF